MKNNNKKIPGIFFSILLLIIALHIVLYFTYKEGKLTRYKIEYKSPASGQSFHHLLLVGVHNITGAT